MTHPLSETNRDLHTSDVARTVYSTDNSIYQVRPDAVSVPRSASDVAALIRANAQRNEPSPIVARGGGTGTNGQSLTNGVVVDLKRGLNNIVSIDPEAAIAVVQPGVVTGALNDELKEHGLIWAPHTSTLNRATIGGMIATDAAGKGSLVHGRTHRHVVSLEICLDDGSTFTAAPIAIEEAERRSLEADRVGEVWRALLDLPVTEDGAFGLPELARGVSGYGIDRLRYDGMIDPLALIIGAEGTLGIVTEATLLLTPLPTHTTLVGAAYPTFAAALEDAVELRSTAPTAIEALDQRTLDAGRQSLEWPVFGAFVPDAVGAVLLLEYESETVIDDAQVLDAIRSTGRSIASMTIPTAEGRASAWKIRADAVGLLANPGSNRDASYAKPTAFVEDCAVPVESMVGFIADFRRTLDDAGLDYAMFGHADVGCVHVRPAINLSDPAHEALVTSLTTTVSELVQQHGGILWGEHGQGFRGSAAGDLLTADTLAIMAEVKSIFDPTDMFNPGKLYRPTNSTKELTGIDEAPMRGQFDRAVPVSIRNDFSSAFACNGNGICHSHSANNVMCPSFKATNDPAMSPKGRADLLREFLSRRHSLVSSDLHRQSNDEFEDAVAENLNQCLSCSACSALCPVEVDIPELKSRFLEAYYETRKRPRSHAALSKFESFAALGGRAAGLARYNTKQAGRALGLVDLPSPRDATRPNRHPTFHPKKTPGPFDVVLLRDVFTDRLEPDTVIAAADLLTSLDMSVALSPFVASGKFDHVQGKRAAFRNTVRAQRQLVEDISRTGAQPVAIEPATALLHQHEYPNMDYYYPDAVRHLVDVLYENREALALRSDVPAGPIALLGHCTERSLRPENLTKWAAVLNAAGYDATAPDMGCCGMAGLFGHEVANQRMSRALWNLGWNDVVRRYDVSATGYSCRSQIQRFGGKATPHPVHLLVD